VLRLAFAHVIGRYSIGWLSREEAERLLTQYRLEMPSGPGGPGMDLWEPLGVARGAEIGRAVEIDDLYQLLREHRSSDSEQNDWLARALAVACTGEDHLWQDLGLRARTELSQLIRTHFTTLFYENSQNQRWKKFFYKKLCDRSEAQLCKAPSCGECSDYGLCFGEGEAENSAEEGAGNRKPEPEWASAEGAPW